MLDPRLLYEFDPEVWASVRGQGAPLFHLLEGYVDAGRVNRTLAEALLGSGPRERVVTFDHDALHDYRSRRPAMTFDTFHWVGARTYELAIDKVLDADGRPLLVLHGPEPDNQWERAIAAVLGIAERLETPMLITANGIPMAVPHSRPTMITRHATREDLALGNPSWIDRVEVPGSFSGLLEFRAGQSGRAARGYVAHVPHYLAQAEFPQAAAAILAAVGRDNGLRFDMTELEREAATTLARIDEEARANAETLEAVLAMEEQYDRAAERHEAVPSAEEIGAEFERFLAEREDGDG